MWTFCVCAPPASSSRTFQPCSSAKRPAKVEPAEPAPTEIEKRSIVKIILLFQYESIQIICAKSPAFHFFLLIRYDPRKECTTN